MQTRTPNTPNTQTALHGLDLYEVLGLQREANVDDIKRWAHACTRLPVCVCYQ